MRIFLCLHHFLPDTVGGTEVYTQMLATQLIELGHEAIVVIPNFDQAETIVYDYDGIKVIKYSEVSREDRNMILGKRRPDGLTVFEDLLKKESPHVVHFHELAPGRGINIFHVEKAHELNIPVILTFHLSYYTCMKGSLVYRNERKCDGVIRAGRCTSCIYHEKGLSGLKAKLLYATAVTLFRLSADPTILNNSIGTALGFPYVINKLKKDLLQLATMADKIVVLADWYKKVLLDNGVPPQKLIKLPQGMTMDYSSPGNDTQEITGPLKIVYLGRISKLKGLHLLIDAVCSLPENSISLSIYGPEAEAGYVAENMKKTQLKRNILWKGKVASSEVISTLSQYHVLCIPSEFEMSPLVIQEAFAAGLPVLASDVYGNREQVQNGVNGWLFQFQNSKDLADKLSMLSTNIRLVQEAKKHLPVPRNFSFVAEQYASLYASVLRSKKKIA